MANAYMCAQIYPLLHYLASHIPYMGLALSPALPDLTFYKSLLQRTMGRTHTHTRYQESQQMQEQRVCHAGIASNFERWCKALRSYAAKRRCASQTPHKRLTSALRTPQFYKKHLLSSVLALASPFVLLPQISAIFGHC
jgi:hypothetical protein